jgi:chromosome partitioning protein
MPGARHGRYTVMHGASTRPGRDSVVAIVAALNMKGGVGKTSTCHHLAGTLAALGRRVLLVDNDPQASLTQGFWGPIATAALDPATTIVAIYAGDEPFPEQVIRPTGLDRIDLVPGAQAASDYNTPRGHQAGFAAQTALRSFLDEARRDYDLVLIDCPPNLHLCSWAALVASTHLLVPLQAEDYGAQGLGPVRDLADAVARGPNPDLRLAGLLITMFNARLAIHQMYDGLLREQYGRAVLATRVPYAADYKEAIARRRPIAQYKPKGASARVVRELADELLGRLVDAPCIARGFPTESEAA